MEKGDFNFPYFVFTKDSDIISCKQVERMYVYMYINIITRNSIIFQIDVADSYVIYDIICAAISFDIF